MKLHGGIWLPYCRCTSCDNHRLPSFPQQYRQGNSVAIQLNHNGRQFKHQF